MAERLLNRVSSDDEYVSLNTLPCTIETTNPSEAMELVRKLRAADLECHLDPIFEL